MIIAMLLLLSAAIPLALLVGLVILAYRDKRQMETLATLTTHIGLPTEQPALTPRQIEMRRDSVDAVLVTHPSRPNLDSFYVSSADGYSFYISGPNAERICRDMRQEFGLAIGDHSVEVYALDVTP